MNVAWAGGERPASDSEMEHFVLGSWLLDQGRPGDAIPELRAVVGKDSTKALPHLELARCYAALNLPDSALVQAKAAARLDSTDAEAVLLAGLCLLRVGRAEESALWLEKARRSAPASPAVLMNLVAALQQIGRTEEALNLIYPQMPPALDQPPMYQKRALLFFLLGRWRESADDLVRVLKFSPGLPKAEDQFLLVLSRLQKPEDRFPLLDDVLTAQPGLEKTRTALIRAEMEGGHWAEARPHLDRLLSAHPDAVPLLFTLGVVLEKTGKPDSSLAVFDRLLKLVPNDAVALNYAGYLCIERGIRLDEAMARVRRALEIDPDNAAYLDSYGWGLVQTGEPEKALEPLRRAAAADSNTVEILKHLGTACRKAGHEEEARTVLRRALRLYPQDPDLPGLLGEHPAPPGGDNAHPSK